MFTQVEKYKGDPIFSLVDQFKRDPNPNKVNLSIGFYYDDSGKVPQLETVKEALGRIYREEKDQPTLYLPMEGIEPFRTAVEPLIFGNDLEEVIDRSRVAVMQSLGGSGALRIGGDFLHTYYPEATVWVSDPTWANHIDIFKGVGFTVEQYPYFDRENLQVDFEAMVQAFEAMEANDIVILHPCCHNPTGADLSSAQWDQLLEIIERRALIAFFDMAYQGFGAGVDADAYAIRAAAKRGLTFLVSCSFSKTFSLYGERIGTLCVICEDGDVATNVLGELKTTVRRNYSSPPALGVTIVSTILNDQELKSRWLEEVDEMRIRIRSMRESLVQRLDKQLGEAHFDHLLAQQGMFAFSGLSIEAITILREEYGIYMLNNGRICIAGLTTDNIDYVADSMASVIKRCQA